MKKLLFGLFLFICYDIYGQGSYTVNTNAGSGTVFSSSNTKVVSLSQSGLVSDADLSLWSSTFGSDQTTAIQNILKYVLNNSGLLTTADINGMVHTGQGGSDPTVINSGTFTKLIMNSWIGVLSTSGTIGTTSNGNAF